MYALAIARSPDFTATATTQPEPEPVVKAQPKSRSGLKVYRREERITRVHICAAEALALYGQGRYVEDADQSPYAVPLPDGSGWEPLRDVARVAMSDQQIADIETVIRIGSSVAAPIMVARARFRLAAQRARVESAKRGYARAVALKKRRMAEHGAPTEEMIAWGQRLSGELYYYGWGRSSGRDYGLPQGVAGYSRFFAGRHSGFGPAMDTGDYDLKMAGMVPLEGEWSVVKAAPAGMSVLLAEHQWIDCVRHRSGHNLQWAVPVDDYARDQLGNWLQLHEELNADRIEVQSIEIMGEDYGDDFRYEMSGAGNYLDRDGVACVDKDDAWGVACARIPWLCRDGEPINNGELHSSSRR